MLIFFFAIILLLGKYRLIRMILTVFPRRHSMVPIMLKHVDRHLRAFLGIKALASLVIGIGTMGILLALPRGVRRHVGLPHRPPELRPHPRAAHRDRPAHPHLPDPVPRARSFPLPSSPASAVLHVGISNFIEPRFLGERLDLSFFVIFLSLFFWGWMWGAAGVLLAVPVTASLKIILERIPATSRHRNAPGQDRNRAGSSRPTPLV